MRIFKSLGTTLLAPLIISTVAVTAGVAKPLDKFILAHAMPATHVLEPTSQKFIDALATAGGPKVDYHPGGTLGDWTSLFEQVAQGAIPMSLTWGVSDVDPRLNLAFLSYVAEDWDSGYRLFGPGGAMIDVYNDILADNGLVLLGTVPSGFGGIATRKGVDAVPVNFPADGKGIKIRIPGLPIAVQRFEAWGFSPVPIPFAELHTALQLGTVDARSFGPPAEIIQMKDVIQTYILTRDYFEFAFWLVNRDWWNGLEEKDRQVIQAAVDTAAAWAWAEAENTEKKLLADIRNEGISVVELDEGQFAAAKAILKDKEWRWAEEELGKPLLDKVRAAVDQ